MEALLIAIGIVVGLGVLLMIFIGGAIVIEKVGPFILNFCVLGLGIACVVTCVHENSVGWGLAGIFFLFIGGINCYAIIKGED